MIYRPIINVGLLAIPIVTTVGTLVGIDAHRLATGQRPLFAGEPHNSGSTVKSGLANTRYCDLFNPISPSSKGQLYTLNPNQWGVTEDTVGSLCMNITTITNETYPTNTTAPGFSVTWQFEEESKKKVVHAFPNIKVDDVLPAALHEIQQLDLDLHWTYGVGNETVNSTNVASLNDRSVNSNVALDLFFDNDKKVAQNVSEAKSEMMVWFAGFGDAYPFGFEDGIVKTKTLHGATFNLYTGQNGLGQNVLTWLAANITEKFNGDIYPLISDLFSLKGDVHLSRTDYLGHFSLGTEAFSSKSNVTFWVPTLRVNFQV